MPPAPPSANARLWAPVLVYMAFIFGLSSVSDPPDLPSGFSFAAGHVVLYAGLGLLVLRAVAGGWRGPLTPRRTAAAVALTVIYGITDELHQHFVPPRHMDALDVLADAGGAALAAGAFYARDIIRGRHGL